jgi:uncharacterized protein YkwD
MHARLFALALLAVAAFAAPVQALDLNGFRAQHGRAPLQYDASLAGLAQFHAADLARRGALDHAGFLRERGPLGARAENVSYGCGDESCAILQWSRSAPHRVNMLRRDVGRYGLASVLASSGRRYWVMELGGAPAVRAERKRAPRYMEATPQR